MKTITGPYRDSYFTNYFFQYLTKLETMWMSGDFKNINKDWTHLQVGNEEAS